ncbi:MAG: septal ring lytic transglycosylase RlpA family protein [Chitinophagaceae bacterium]
MKKRIKIPLNSLYTYKNQLIILGMIFGTGLIFSSCSRKITQIGRASFYSDYFNGRETANGEIFHQNRLTAASRTLPFGTRVKVVNLSNGCSVRVRINDRGPYVMDRMIDLSKKAAKRLKMLNQGVAKVKIKYRLPKN